jgi:hypothetical protein
MTKNMLTRFSLYGFLKNQKYYEPFIILAFRDKGLSFFVIGEAFRTGTHKAMIFDWLESEGRTKELTKVYGFTRSWSQMGSAMSVIVITHMPNPCSFSGGQSCHSNTKH